jgi:murein DD-endopeptidase MepM/ murein hydrolase activator NlpD
MFNTFKAVNIIVLLISAVFVSTAAAQDAKFRTPVNGASVMCKFDTTNCYVSGKYHTGVDYYSSNKDILATNAGKIVRIQKNDGVSDAKMGNSVIIEHKIINTTGGSETIYSQYSHLASFVTGLYVGQSVTKGQKLGTMGGSGGGRADYWSVHLHFEIKRSNTLGSDPSGYWGYTPRSATGYNYIDPIWLINSTTTAVGNDYAYWDFNGNGNLEGWSLFNWAGWSVNSGKLFFDAAGSDPYITSPDIFVDASILRYVKFNLASNAPDMNGKVYFKTSTSNFYSEDKSVTFWVTNDGVFRNYILNMRLNNKWVGKITGVRIDPADNGIASTNVDTIGWNWIWISSNTNSR